MKETKQFQTESKELLNLMINSIYSNKEIFLRELISNASDAIDKYKYLSLTSEGKLPTSEGEIWLRTNKAERSLEISDNGIGMTKDDLINNLGTIAKSGSKDFMSKFKEAKEKQDINIIGQFGVGFYSAFMVGDKVEVRTRSYGDQGYLFVSDGKDSFTIEECDDVPEHGTSIKVFLKPKDEDEDYDRYESNYTLENLVKKYSDYVRYPVKMLVEKQDDEKTDKKIEEKVLNSMIPLWKKGKDEVTDEELAKFYKDKFGDYEDPLFSMYIKVDGMVSYNALVFVPAHAPYNLYSENFEKGLQLYAKNIFIKERCPELVPDYLKFVRGLVDSDDFSLNVSREILQASPLLKKISDNIEKKLVDKLKNLKENDFEKYKKFWDIYGEHLKFGIYSTYGAKADMLKDLLLFHHLNDKDNELTTLKEYVEKMDSKQKGIYYSSGETVESIKLQPQMGRFVKDGTDVLLLDRRVDEFCIMMMHEYEKKEFKSISDKDTEEISKEEKNKLDDLTATHKRFIDTVTEALKGQVDSVAFSNKLTDAPVCISTTNGMSLGMEKTLNEQPGAEGDIKASKVLEINPDHELFQAISALEEDNEAIKSYASLLYDEAMLLEGYEIKDKTGFVKKLNEVMIKAAKK